jgi:hypothetical protein
VAALPRDDGAVIAIADFHGASSTIFFVDTDFVINIALGITDCNSAGLVTRVGRMNQTASYIRLLRTALVRICHVLSAISTQVGSIICGCHH